MLPWAVFFLMAAGVLIGAGVVAVAEPHIVVSLQAAAGCRLLPEAPAHDYTRIGRPSPMRRQVDNLLLRAGRLHQRWCHNTLGEPLLAAFPAQAWVEAVGFCGPSRWQLHKAS